MCKGSGGVRTKQAVPRILSRRTRKCPPEPQVVRYLCYSAVSLLLSTPFFIITTYSVYSINNPLHIVSHRYSPRGVGVDRK